MLKKQWLLMASAVLFAGSAAALPPAGPTLHYVTDYTFLCPGVIPAQGSTVVNTSAPGQFQVIRAPCYGGQLMSWTTHVVSDN
ncbi:MAG TPA: hypothetical protein VF132_03335 [Rudaea sp.]